MGRGEPRAGLALASRSRGWTQKQLVAVEAAGGEDRHGTLDTQRQRWCLA